MSLCLRVQEWGQHCDLATIDVNFHVPSDAERAAVKELLTSVMLPELAALRAHRSGETTLDREELKQRLKLVYHCVVGAGNQLPMLTGQQLDV